MPSSVLITLDTTAPSIELGAADVDLLGTIRIPYTVDEPAILSATIGGIPALVEPDRLVAAGAPLQGDVDVTATDDVLNSRRIVQRYGADRGVIGRIVAGVIGRIASAAGTTIRGGRTGDPR